MHKILRVSDAMVGESSFPNLHRASELVFYRVRVAAFDELHRAFERYSRWSEQQMKMLGHEYEGVQLKLSLPSI